MEALRRARVRRGWSMTRAAKETGVSRPMISLLERGLLLPSASLAEALIAGYGMSGPDADSVRSIALEWVGRDSPFRTGVSPPWPASETSWDTQGNGTHRGDGRGTASDGSWDGQGKGRSAVTAEQWIEWARRKAEEAQTQGNVPSR